MNGAVSGSSESPGDTAERSPRTEGDTPRPTLRRRTFLLTASGLSVLALTGCVSPTPVPTPSRTRSPRPPEIPAPISMRRSSWSADPFARGSFSFAEVGSTPADREALREPVGERLFFAGEATAIDEPGTIQGARESGLRAAVEVAAVAEPGERVTIVGAGVAGIAAARQLADAGFEVLVIEARTRVGGRISTVTDAEDWPFPIELGPSFVRNVAESPIDEELARLGVVSLPFPAIPDTRTSSGTVPEPSTIGAETIAAALAWAADQSQDISVERALVDSGEEAKLSVAPGDTGVSERDWLDYEIATRLKIDAGTGASQLSAWYAAESARGVTEQDRLVLGGFNTLVTDPAKGLEILTSSVVTRVAASDDGVSLRLGAGEALSADRVIVTVPLGVLQKGGIEFEPPLPFAQRGAIAALGMGLLDKVWLRFDEPFWDTDASLWTVVGGDADFPVWVNLMPLTGQPVLMGIVAAENAVRLAEVSDAEFLEAALLGLEPFIAES